jgi:RNA polymerase sigma-70 factor, ECF subfamily
MTEYTQIDITLIQRIARTDSTALSELYDRYGRMVFSVAVQVLGDSSTAEEVTQDVFVQIWNKASTYQESMGKVHTWIASVARHRAIDQYRRRSIRPEGHSVVWENCCEDLENAALAVEPGIIDSERHRALLQALNTLPEDQRKALTLAYFYGMTHEEIAAQLSQPLGTIKTRIRMALQKLRTVFGPASIEI